MCARFRGLVGTHGLGARARGPGRSGGTRTPGTRFWRPVLYRLSYTPARRTSPGHLPPPLGLVFFWPGRGGAEMSG